MSVVKLDYYLWCAADVWQGHGLSACMRKTMFEVDGVPLCKEHRPPTHAVTSSA